MTHRRKTIAAGAASIALAMTAVGLTGCEGARTTVGGAETSSAAGAPTPSTTAAVPDLSVHRTFTLSDGATATCTIDLSIAADPSTQDPDAPQHARSVLSATDWQTVPVSLDQMPADEQAERTAQGVGEAELLAMILQDDIHTALVSSGANTGVQTSAHTVC